MLLSFKAVYLNKNIQGKLLDNLCVQLPHIETLIVDVLNPVKCVVCMIYRSPNSNTEDFL